jgi:hypothetical protein
MRVLRTKIIGTLGSKRKLAVLPIVVASASWILCAQVGGQTPTLRSLASAEGGIWKAAVPPKTMKGEFDNFDPLGVAAGVRIKADCSLNWTDPDDGALYCFSSGTSLQYFLDEPHANIKRARRKWLALEPATH